MSLLWQLFLCLLGQAPKVRMSHWVSGIGYQAMPLLPDLECSVLECARSWMSHWIHFQFLPPTDPSFAGGPGEIASELPPMGARQKPSNTVGLAGTLGTCCAELTKGLGVGLWRGGGGQTLDWCLFVCFSSFPSPPPPKGSVPLKVTTLYGPQNSAT